MKKYMIFTAVFIIMAVPLVLVFSTGLSDSSGDPIVYANWSTGSASSECSQVGNYTFSLKIKDISVGASKSTDGNTITLGNVSLDEGEAKSLTWSSSNAVGAVIVHAGEGANVWFYNPQVKGDSGLYGFQNGNISQITFCWNGSLTEEITPENEVTQAPSSTSLPEETATPASTEETEEDEVDMAVSETPEPEISETPTASSTDEEDLGEPTQTETPSDETETPSDEMESEEGASEEEIPDEEKPAEEASILLQKQVALINNDSDLANFSQPGDKITYSFTITNTGNVTLSDVTLSDPMAEVSGNPIAFLEPGESDSINYSAEYFITQADIDAGNFTNTASVAGLSPSGDSIEAKASAIVNGSQQEAKEEQDETASLQLVKEVASINGDPDAFNFTQVGDLITYAFTVTNTGSVEITDITISDLFASVTGEPISSLAPGESDSTSYTAAYVITQEDINACSFTNTASASGLSLSGEAVSDEASVTVKGITEEASIQVVMQIAAVNGYAPLKKFNSVGDKITFSITITNTGAVELTNISISESIANISGGPIASLAPGESNSTTFSATYTITEYDIDAEFFTNTALVSGESPAGCIITGESTATVKMENRRLH